MFNNNILNIQQNSVQYKYGDLQHFYKNDKVKDKSYIFHLAGRNNKIRYNISMKYLVRLVVKSFKDSEEKYC